MIARLPKSFLDYGVYALPHTVYNSTPSSAYLVRSELGQVSEDFLPISDRGPSLTTLLQSAVRQAIPAFGLPRI
ncbi:unnamed protein product [Penicillium camemberti]|uniref:Str. FM013 n=1 Tax=Penicillium camemberti (strain FM 013) TaxID=1429867 RepID=A0A0G4P3B1_PENC3|nr:unnamed protein product [Penicillium camemberti]